MTLCKYCGASSSFINAHIIPEAFFRELREGTRAPLLITGRVGEFPKKAPIGVYDQEMLCGVCEERFLSEDTYGIDVLLKNFEQLFQPIEGGRAFASDRIDKNLLLRFFVAVLWRASVSAQPFYRRVALGPYETEALNVLRHPTTDITSVFDAVMSRWEEPITGGVTTAAMLDPYPERWDGVNAYRLYLGRVVAYVKVDKQPFRAPFANLSLQADGPCQIVSRNFAESKDLRAMKHTAVASAKNHAALRGRRGAA